MINTTLIPSLTIDKVSNLAEWQAKHALRAGRQAKLAHENGQMARALAFEYERDVHINKMYDILEASRYPRLTTAALVRMIGRGKAMVLKIERPIINLALNS